MQSSFMKAYDATLVSQFGEHIRMSDFIGIHAPAKIIADQEYTIKRAAKRKQKSKLAASYLEAIFIEGVNVGGWLGDGDAYQTLAWPTAIYDDISHRVDTVVNLVFRQPIRSHDGKDTLQQATIGFDVTVGGEPSKVLDKLTRHYSDQARLPFGFSHLDYYFDGQHRSIKPLLIRYVIGVNIHEVLEIWGDTQSDPSASNHLSAFRPNSPASLQMRFKILSEIRRQNMFYYAMLPEDQDDRVIRTAALQLDAVDECLNASLRDCTKQIVARRVVPSAIFAIKQRGRKVYSERDIIEEYLITENQRRYRNRDPFTQIMSQTRKLLDSLYNESEDSRVRQALTRRRKIMVQNQALQISPANL